VGTENNFLSGFVNIFKTRRDLFKQVFLFTAVCIYMYSWVIIVKQNYSNVPYWDEWNSRLEMNPYTNSLGLSDFWQPSNEHRIVISRLIFFLGFIFSNGNSISLILLNFFLQSVLTYIVIKRIFPDQSLRAVNFPGILLIIVVIVIQFSSLQRDNFTWAFQSGFFVMTLFSFLAFDHIAKFITNFKGTTDRNFWLAIFFGILSIGTMGSGIFVLPILSFILLMNRVQLKYAFIVAMFAVLSFSLYFHNYNVQSKSPFEVLKESGITPILSFVNFFVTAPLHEVLNQSDTFLSNAIFILICTTLAVQIIKTSRKNAARSQSQILGIAILIFVLLSAVSTAIGRISIGIEQAYASRYMTVSFFGFLGFILLARPSLFQKNKIKGSATFILLPLILLFGNFQYHSLSYQNVNVSAQKSAALALSLQINDSELMQSVFYDYPKAQSIANQLIKKRQSVFGENYIQELQGQLGRKILKSDLPDCMRLSVLEVKPITGGDQFRFLLEYEPVESKKDRSFIPLNKNGIINGGSYIFPEKVGNLGPRKLFMYAQTPVSEIIEVVGGDVICTRRVLSFP
jgi:hypothetical protein